MESNELRSLLSLLDDPDHEIYHHVADRLLSLGPSVIPSLESYWENAPDPLLQHRIEHLIHTIQFTSLCEEFRAWIVQPYHDLLDGALLVAKYKYYNTEKNLIRNYLDIIKRAIWLELNHNLTPFEQINVFNHVFYGMKGFSGKSGSDMNTYFLNRVIDTKAGNAVSLGILYQILANELDIPVYGVNLPRHYVLAYCKTFFSETELNQDQQKHVLFYINPMSKGAIFTRNEIKAYLQKINLEESPQCYAPCSPLDTIKLMLEHLHYLYSDQQESQGAEEISQLLEMFPTK